MIFDKELWYEKVMKVLVIGSGGREHALVRALRNSSSVKEVHAWPGNDGMSREAFCYTKVSGIEDLMETIRQQGIQLVVVGPEAFLVEGVADKIRARGVDVFGPSQAGAQLEASKVNSKEFMRQSGVPTAYSEVVASVSDVKKVLSNFTPPYVLKADGLAAGKGVTICRTKEDLLKSSQRYFEDKIFGEAGTKALLEQFQEGWELSCLILTNGEDYIPLPLSQDHKRLGEGDTGPNTGGMGVVGPLEVGEELKIRLHEEILKPSVRGLKNENLDYRGLLYVGIMVTPQGLKVIEYNVRFGDPEAQVILPLLNGDWGEVFQSVARGELPKIQWKPLYAACIVMAAENYPESPVRGTEITGDIFWESPSSYFLHAGAKKNKSGEWVTNGGRVFNSVAIGSNVKEALKNSYKQADQVTWVGMQMRRDIGHHLKSL